MKKLVCVKDIENFINEGKTKFYVDCNMIITPSAQDLAKAKGVIFTKESPICEVTPLKGEKFSLEGMDNEVLLQVFKVMMEKGVLQELISTLSKQNSMPYNCECDASGLKVVRGNSVKMDVFDTGDPNVKAYFQELVSKEESKMSAGFLVIENSRFDWELTYEEIDYVIEGTLTIEINGKTFTAYPGDVLFVPSGSKVVWGSPDKAKVFYATYPANWADLL
ncbi:Ethanolamine utilization protein eutQ [uncultured Clostridium sp.]|uniref:cupin domain-containing protein n=1 Tax=uncultured Clostridium sp. TaxID=59620 RepID=UPI0008212CD0|nr:cupin domain-containing protein [uncultured Clostridium sp.]SCI74011.1 Ethanolamine utilization protein eutQ [uncultured Clostridium sp.]